jgi:hypothetical protein
MVNGVHGLGTLSIRVNAAGNGIARCRGDPSRMFLYSTP